MPVGSIGWINTIKQVRFLRCSSNILIDKHKKKDRLPSILDFYIWGE